MNQAHRIAEAKATVEEFERILEAAKNRLFVREMTDKDLETFLTKDAQQFLKPEFAAELQAEGEARWS